MVKIEEIEEKQVQINKHETKPKVKRNPFESTRKPTIRRDPNDRDITKRKGLNEPDFLGDSPLDLLFQELSKKLDSEDLSLNSLYDKFLIKEESSVDPFTKRYQLIQKLLDYLLDVAKLSREKKSKNKSLITISLHDMKLFSKLVNMIIVHGIYPSLTNNNGIPINKRRLNDFKSTQKLVQVNKVQGYDNCEKLLLVIYRSLMKVFMIDGDVKDLLLRGTGYSDFLIVTIDLITNPNFASKNDTTIQKEFSTVEKFSDTYELYTIYSLLLTTQSSVVFKQFVSKRISLLPIERFDGLQTLIEFVVGLREDEEINIEKFQHVTNIILAKPRDISAVTYFNKIGNQLYDILILINRPVLTSVACYIVEELYNKNSKIVADFIFKKIWSNFNPHIRSDSDVSVSEAQLNNTINVLISLTKKSGFLDFLMEPILLQLWNYLLFLKKSNKTTEIVMNILISYFTITDNISTLDFLVKNLLYSNNEHWEFSYGPNALPSITKRASRIDQKEAIFADLDVSIELLMILLEDLNDELLKKEFLIVLKRWLKIDETDRNKELVNLEKENPFDILLDLRLLESMSNKFNDKLAKSPVEMLEIVESVLINYEKKENPFPVPAVQKSFENIIHQDNTIGEDDSDDEEDNEEIDQSIGVVLELLSAILSETSNIDLNETCFTKLKDIHPLLLKLSEKEKAAKSLHQRISIIINGEKPALNNRELEERVLSRAITNLNDPLVPIRAHGLYLLRELIKKKSDVISTDFVIGLHLNQLKDSEPFIYLNSIKGLESITEATPNVALPILTGIYSTFEDTEYSIDEKLRVGEVLLRFIELSNEMLTIGNASSIADATLKMIRRRDENQFDNRLRMSAMSLLGCLYKTNPNVVLTYISDALDCVLGILSLETAEEEAIMRRSSIVMIHDLIIGSQGLHNFPKSYGKECLHKLRFCAQNDTDLLVRDQAEKVLGVIRDVIQDSIISNREISIPDSYNKLNILQ